MPLCLALAACQAKNPAGDEEAKPETVPVSNGDGSGAVSTATPESKPAEKPVNVHKSTKWPPAEVSSGTATVSCDVDPGKGESRPLTNLEFFSVVDAMSPCQESGAIRLSYSGKIAADFTDLVDRVGAMADRMDIRTRVLDLDSSGGRVEDAMKAGDIIAESRWTLRVGEAAICHSACVLVLAAGDDRAIAGKVGIHRMVRIGSKASSRTELSEELQQVYQRMKAYLERNGASVAVADLMMTVPNRSLRLLGEDELKEYGLDGTNAAQDDLERIVLSRKCGEDFVKRKDEYSRAYEAECAAKKTGTSVACAAALDARYGFPDPKCPADGPQPASG
ncbi:hypothetical protein FCE95_06340 [Luteimonas gilva]|uniref:Uncharacterized protein n=1 Tax=Luteimonas gilva TaxID=2572684 RepID=A0A4U5JZJ2_9GAMM|nr:hypothetical protein FCE95_06340 [Luteimonas gilva]